MLEERKKWALSWMYNNLSHKWFEMSVMDRSKNPDSTLTETYTNTEIHSLFETLRKEDYIFPVVNQHGSPCFILNEMKELEWINRIEDTSPSKARVVGRFFKTEGFIWYREIASGFIGAAIVYIATRISDG